MNIKIISIGILFILSLLFLNVGSGGLDETKTNAVDSNHNISRIYPEQKTGTSHRIFAGEIKIRDFRGIKDEKSITNIANDFISKNENLLNARSCELKLIKFDSDNENYYINYQQQYKGILVHRNFVGLTIKRNGKISVMGSDFQKGINVSTTPEISKGDAIDIAKKEMNFSSIIPGNEVMSISPVIFPLNDTNNTGKYHLTWKINIITDHPIGDWILFIDANSGEIIYKYSALKSGSINGFVTGMIYLKRYDEEPALVNFSYEKIYTNLTTAKSQAFYSGFGGVDWVFYDSSATLINPINLVNKTHINLSFLASYDIESGWDFAYVELSNDSGATWYQLNGTQMSTYHHPQVYAEGWINNSQAYTGDSNGVIYETINLDEYSGDNILLRFRYTTDQFLFKEGFYVDNISIAADGGIIFFETANTASNWNLSGFNLTNVSFATSNTITDENGYYELNEIPGSINIRSELKGLWVDVDNEDLQDAEYNYNLSYNFTYNSTYRTHNWNWNDSDLSYNRVESNVYYHVNKIHDYFKKFNFNYLDYPLTAVVNYGTDVCNAHHSPGADRLVFYEGNAGCENLGLGSDIIYHEYTHAVIHHIYDLEPYSGESGALDEALADYFATSINNDSVIADGWFFSRNLDNNLTMDNWYDEVHADGRIMGGALWNLRKEFGAEYADSLIFEAIRTTPHAYNFSEFLENLLIADDDNANLYDDTPNKIKICNIFYERKIYSLWCSDLRPDLALENLTCSPRDPDLLGIIKINVSIKNSGINLNLSEVNVSLFVNGIYNNSEILNLVNKRHAELNFNWSAARGEHNITIRIDPQNLINETCEENNEISVKLIVYHECDFNQDNLILKDYNDLMTAYKCFLGVEKNCRKISYRSWIVMKREYDCFIGD